MNKIKILPCVLLLVLLSGATEMNAQSDQNQKQALSPQQKSIVLISALTATGDLENLQEQLSEGLNAGLTINEVKELLVQLYAYCGFPRSLNAISTFMDVLGKRKADGLIDPQGKQENINNEGKDKYEQGRKVLETLTKMPQPRPAPGFGEFAPKIDRFLKEHLFADIFESDVLTYQQRELITISALASMPGVIPQLQSHVKMGTNVGLTNEQLAGAALLIEKFVSKTQANSLRKMISEPAVPVIEEDMMVRISEIDILPEYLNEYNAILKKEAAASVEKEPGVLAIFPMSLKEQPAVIRIVEIYADKSAYQSHLKTPHFQHYKTSTLKMVKSLKLIDMNAMDQDAMSEIFKKLK